MDKELVRDMYLGGMSTREIATKIGSDSGNVYRAIKDIAQDLDLTAKIGELVDDVQG